MGIKLSKVLVTGGRDFNDFDRLAQELADILGNYGQLLIIEGGAPGADAMAREWAKLAGQHYATVPALWDTYDKRAGPVRNAVMVGTLEPDIVVAMPGGPGTRNCIKEADKVGINVRIG